MYNKKTKTAIMKWRENNKENYDEYVATYMREIFYKKNCDKIKEKRMKKYYWEKECKRFREILL